MTMLSNPVPTLNHILDAKRHDLAQRKLKTPLEAVRALASMQQRPTPFLNTVTERGLVTLIARVSYTPTPDSAASGAEDPVAQAIRYARSGLDTISLFTDGAPYRGGMDDLMFMARAVRALHVPVITQDYIFDEYQVIEVRAAGASGLVLDAALLDAATLRGLVSAAQRNRLTAIVRVETPAQLERAMALSPQAIALCEDPACRTLPTGHLHHLRPRIPRHIRLLVPCATLDDVSEAAALGVDAIFLDPPLLANDILPQARARLQIES